MDAPAGLEPTLSWARTRRVTDYTTGQLLERRDETVGRNLLCRLQGPKPERDDGLGHVELLSRRERFVASRLIEGCSLLLAKDVRHGTHRPFESW